MQGIFIQSNSCVQKLKVVILNIWTLEVLVITIYLIQNHLIYVLRFILHRPLKSEMVQINLFRVKSKIGHTSTEKGNLEQLYTSARTFYIYITIWKGNFEWFIVIIHISHMVIFHLGHKLTKNIIFGCQSFFYGFHMR